MLAVIERSLLKASTYIDMRYVQLVLIIRLIHLLLRIFLAVFSWLCFILKFVDFPPQQIEKYRALAREIMGLPSIEHYDMIRLDCEDLKVGLAMAARGLAEELLSRVSADHRRENEV